MYIRSFLKGLQVVIVQHQKMMLPSRNLFVPSMRFKSSHGHLGLGKWFAIKHLQAFRSSTTAAGDNENKPAKKKRARRKKDPVTVEEHMQDKYVVVAYSTAEQYQMAPLAAALDKQGLYKPVTMPDDVEKVLHVTANYQVDKEQRHMYFFSEGSVVLWNVPLTEQRAILSFLKPFEVNPFSEELIMDEREDFDYFYTENESKLSNGEILLKANIDTQLVTYAFSNALAHSVKLASWEASLEEFTEGIQFLTNNMRDGKKLKLSGAEVFRKRGEIFSLRHVINLSSDLLDTPDFYWDRENLEKLYHQTHSHLNIAKRTKVMNERLTYCSDLVELLGNRITDRHHIRLELMIIALILVEVMFEFAHFMERTCGNQQSVDSQST